MFIEWKHDVISLPVVEVVYVCVFVFVRRVVFIGVGKQITGMHHMGFSLSGTIALTSKRGMGEGKAEITGLCCC